MSNMEILALFMLTLSLTAAQQRPRNQRFQNPGFQNARTPLATSATRDRPFISIPIVLLPDGRPLPKPKHSTYHYVGHTTQNAPRQNNQRNNKHRGPMMGKSAANYQIAVPPPISPPQQKKVEKPPKLTVAQLNSHVRNNQNNYPKYRGHTQNAPQQNQAQKPQQQTFDQTQQMHQIQYLKQQRSPSFQQQGSHSSPQTTLAHKQNIANFVNFATNLGAAIASQQQNQQVILPTQTPASGLTFHNQASHKIAESYLNQRPLISNHKLNGGLTFQHQVPNPQAAQVQYTQVLSNNADNHNNGYTLQQHIPQQQQQQQASQQHIQQQQQEQEQTQQTQGSAPSESQYLSATGVRSNTQTANQGTDLQNNLPYQANQGSLYQQSSSNSHRTQTAQTNAALVNSFNSQAQQSNQQNYAVATTPQQPTPAPQIASTYGTQSQLSKGGLTVQQQTGASVYSLNPQSMQSSYVNQNQQTQNNQNLNSQSQQPSYSNSPQTSSQGYSAPQGAQSNTFALQSTQSNGGQINDPLTYYQYQTAQEIPLNYASLFSQGQSGYLSSSQNTQQNEPSTQDLDQSFAILPSAQNLFTSSVGPAIYVSPQQEENTSSDSPSEIGVQTYEAYSGEQSSYPSSTSQSNQASQASFINTQNIEKNYQNSQYGYLLQNSPNSQSGQSIESQLSQSASSIGSGQLLFDSSSPKQINYSPTQTSYASQTQQYSPANYQNSQSYISFPASNSNFKSDSQTSVNYGTRTPVAVPQAVVNQGVNSGVVTPGSTYAKLNQAEVKQQEASEQSEDTSEDQDYDEEEETNDEEASYKVVYIPLDILKNILSNSVENK